MIQGIADATLLRSLIESVRRHLGGLRVFNDGSNR
jgi:hypothetical protein